MSKNFLFATLFLFFVAAGTGYLLGDFESLAAYFWTFLPPLIAAFCGTYAVKTYNLNNPHAKAIAILSLGVFFWFIGEFIWFIFEYFLDKDPFPSIADFFYLIAYPILLIGLFVELKTNKVSWDLKKALVGALFAVVFSVLVFYFGIYLAFDPEETLINNLVAIAYGLGDLILIIFTLNILTIVLGYKKGKLCLPWICILAGFFALLAADILFAVYRKEYEEFLVPYRLLDLGWTAGFLLIAYGFYNIGFEVKKAAAKLLLSHVSPK
ncbi:MAG: hypothetical protein FJZ04_04015 [Candidatus Moranbacteria bacterium]|nr:hypothetical protein [Candidatus Moranbacteria bacterium]